MLSGMAGERFDTGTKEKGDYLPRVFCRLFFEKKTWLPW
jgi:hypothetical protein